MPGHGRTDLFGLEERIEEYNPPVAARTCSGCGKPYVANGADESSVVEIEVRAHRRVTRLRRWRRGCECASSPVEVSVPPAPQLFTNTPYGISVWTRFLFEHHTCSRPLHRIAAWLSDQGLPITPGTLTLAGSVPRFVPLFEPLAKAIRAHQNEAILRHADETTWRVQALRETGASSRSWLWASVSDDAIYFHIVVPSRSAEAAHKRLGGLVTLSFCWSHLRRDVIDFAVGQEWLTLWCQRWLDACAHNGGRPPVELAPWLPWSMDEARRHELAAPT